MRLFIAVDLPDAVKKKLGAYSRQLYDALRDPGSEVRWVDQAQFHITLKFLGDCDESRIPALQKSLQAMCLSEKPFNLQVTGSEPFPATGAPRVLWVRLGEGQNILGRIAEKTEEACKALGFPFEAHPYTPHVTLGRIKRPGEPGAIQAALDAVSFPALEAWSVHSVDLIRSHLSARGSAYETVHPLPLQT
jgi:RNA 2',3'-cyclic 3'-phosphodiesterase